MLFSGSLVVFSRVAFSLVLTLTIMKYTHTKSDKHTFFFANSLLLLLIGLRDITAFLDQGVSRLCVCILKKKVKLIISTYLYENKANNM